jgi:hypothetical protein
MAGRKTVEYKTEIKYVHGEVVRDTVHFPVPVREVVHDTILLIERDTVKTLIDWNTERYYTERLFNDNRGLLDVSASVQFNRLYDLSFEFVPIYKEITKYKVPVWQLYAGVSYSTFGIVGIGGGLFRNHIGVEYQLQYSFPYSRKGHLIGLRYKF